MLANRIPEAIHFRNPPTNIRIVPSLPDKAIQNIPTTFHNTDIQPEQVRSIRMNNDNLEEVNFTEESQIQEQNIQINSDQIEREKFSL